MVALDYIDSVSTIERPSRAEVIAFMQGPLPEVPPGNPNRCYDITVAEWHSLLWALACAAAIGDRHATGGMITVTVYHGKNNYFLAVSGSKINARGPGGYG